MNSPGFKRFWGDKKKTYTCGTFWTSRINRNKTKPCRTGRCTNSCVFVSALCLRRLLPNKTAVTAVYCEAECLTGRQSKLSPPQNWELARSKAPVSSLKCQWHFSVCCPPQESKTNKNTCWDGNKSLKTTLGLCILWFTDSSSPCARAESERIDPFFLITVCLWVCREYFQNKPHWNIMSELPDWSATVKTMDSENPDRGNIFESSIS